ncbi:MAG: hypothetical protein HY791_16615 [Deltaproteobacteria bacterium]|nr:hypothetical protein [Deltaproteobacteria bacterium]
MGAAACSPSKSSPRIGIETILAESGLAPALLEKAKQALDTEPIVVTDESSILAARLKAGELELALTNGDLTTESLLRDGTVTSAKPILHHETVLVGPAGDPLEIHAQRSFVTSMRLIYEGDAAFFQCTACGLRARLDAIFARERSLIRKGNSFRDVGPSESDVVKALIGAPGYALLSRPTVIRLLKSKDWTMKPLWSGDALQVDNYRVLLRPSDRIEEPRRVASAKLEAWLTGPSAKAIIESFGLDTHGQAVFRAGPAPEGEGFKASPR